MTAREEVARLLWNRFSPDHETEFPGAAHEWGDTADQILLIAAACREASTVETNQPVKEVAGVSELKHAANEWADAFYAAVRWIKNIDEEISTPCEALVNLEECAAHCQSVWAAALTQGSQP